MYKIPELEQKNIDFNLVYPDKQEIVREATGMFFGLQDIVNLCREETDNFTKSNVICEDIDKAIYDLTKKWIRESGEEIEEPEPEEPENVVRIKKETADVEELLDIVQGKEKKRLQKELNDLKETLELITM